MTGSNNPDPNSDGPPPHDIEEIMVELLVWFFLCSVVFAGFKLFDLV